MQFQKPNGYRLTMIELLFIFKFGCKLATCETEMELYMCVSTTPTWVSQIAYKSTGAPRLHRNHPKIQI